MSDFGFWELALVMLVALLIVGPERLPQLLSTVGRWIGRIKKLTAQLKDEFAEEASTRDVKRILSDAQDTINKAGSDIKREFADTDPLVRAIEDQIDEGRFTADSGTDNSGDSKPATDADQTGSVEKKQ